MREKMLWEAWEMELDLRRIAWAGGNFAGEGAREDARLEATMALARESPLVRGVTRRGCIW